MRTTHTTHAPAEARLGDVRAPAVVVMGTDDVDWKDPAAEAGLDRRAARAPRC